MTSEQALATLIASLVAATTGIIGLLVNTFVTMKKQRDDVLARVAAQRFVWAKEVRTYAAEFVGTASMYLYYFRAGQQNAKDNVEAAHQIMKAQNGLTLLLEESDQKSLEKWSTDFLAHVKIGKFDEASTLIVSFPDMISPMIAAEVRKAGQELKGMSR